MSETVENLKAKASGYSQRLREQAKRTWSRATRFASENKELLIAGVPIAIAGIKLGQSQLVNRRIKNERKRIDTTFYDPSTGFHWDLKRKATNKDRAMISKLKAEGELSMYDILRKLDLV